MGGRSTWAAHAMPSLLPRNYDRLLGLKVNGQLTKSVGSRFSRAASAVSIKLPTGSASPLSRKRCSTFIGEAHINCGGSSRDACVVTFSGDSGNELKGW